MAMNDEFSCVRNYTMALRVVGGITCVLSMVGSVLIILSYFIVPGLQTKAREILLNLSLMDFLVAASNFLGIVLNFGKYWDANDIQQPDAHHNSTWYYACITQASFAMYGSISSVIWTIFIAVYIYFRVMTEEWITRKSVFYFYLIAYGLPAIVVVWQATTNKLGFDRHSGSTWCSTIVKQHDGTTQPINAVFVSDIWSYMTIFVILAIFISLHFHFKYEVRTSAILTRTVEVTVHNVEVKLLFIPLFFILLRLWSFAFIILEVEIGVHLHCPVKRFFLFASGIGDSAQGLTNCILYVFFTHKVRRYFLQFFLCKGLFVPFKSMSSLPHKGHSSYSPMTSEISTSVNNLDGGKPFLYNT